MNTTVKQQVKSIQKDMLIDKATQLLYKHGFNSVGEDNKKSKISQLIFEERLSQTTLSL